MDTENSLGVNSDSAVKQCLQSVDTVLDIYLSDKNDFKWNTEESKKLFLNLKRARQEFESKKFFVVIYGPVKSGKSTLTNCFARQYVSPSKFGVECTARPSFIIQSDESAIYEYYPIEEEKEEFIKPEEKESLSAIEPAADETVPTEAGLEQEAGDTETTTEAVADDASETVSVPIEETAPVVEPVRDIHVKPDTVKVDEKKYFDLIIDYLRGIASEEELRAHIHIEKYDLTKEHVETKLIANQEKKPLVTVVKVQGGGFLSPEIAIVDMPGLDGTNCNIRDTPIYNWFLEKTDLMIFVQSSMAAINVETMDFLEKLVSQSKNPPTWFVQNLIDCKYWRTLEERMNDAEEQLMETKSALVHAINPPEGDINATTINLGKAADGLDDKNAELLADSGFEDFEQQIRRLIEMKRIRISEKNGLSAMLRTCNEILRIFHENRNENFVTTKDMSNLRQSLEDFIKLPDTIVYSENDMVKYHESLKQQVENETQRLLDYLNNGVEQFKEKVNKTVTGESLNFLVNDFVRNTIRNANKIFFNINSVFGGTIANSINESVDALEKTFHEEIVKKIADINQSISTLAPDLSPIKNQLEELPNFTVDGLKEVFPKDGFDVTPYKVKEKFLGILGNMKYNGVKNQELADRIHADISEYFKSTANDWMEKTSTSVYDVYCEKRRTYYHNLVDQMEDGKKAVLEEVDEKNKDLMKQKEDEIVQMNVLQELLQTTVDQYTI